MGWHHNCYIGTKLHTIVRYYTHTDLRLTHYAWDIDRRSLQGCYDLNDEELDLSQGYEVLLYANSFLNLYLPDHTADHLHAVEYVLLHHLPKSLRAKGDVAAWMAKNISNLETVKRLLPFGN